jgi:hypothetical protein
MSLINRFLAWTAGALAYEYATVYLLDEFDRGYGRLAYFQLSLYIAMISVAAGPVGYAAVARFQPWSGSVVTTFMAAIAFTVCVHVAALVLAWVAPDRDMTVQGFVAALVIGALSALVGRPGAAQTLSRSGDT